MKSNQTCEVRGFFLNIINGFLLLICFIIVILFIVGLVQVQTGLNEIFRVGKNGSDRIPLSVKGFLNLSITLMLFFCLELFINNTLRKRKWWQKLIRTFDLDTESIKTMTELKGKASDIFLIFNGSIVFVGLLMIVIGLIFLNAVDTITLNIVSGIIVILGIFPILLGFKRYQSDVENFIQFTVPSLIEGTRKTDEQPGPSNN
jgi:hypothetical protein